MYIYSHIPSKSASRVITFSYLWDDTLRENGFHHEKHDTGFRKQQQKSALSVIIHGVSEVGLLVAAVKYIRSLKNFVTIKIKISFKYS